MPRTETKNTSEKHYVYILRCCDDSLYTGWTTDLKKRIETHNKGNGAKYTRARLPVQLVYFEEFADKLIAQSREREIKKIEQKTKRSPCREEYLNLPTAFFVSFPYYFVLPNHNPI